MEEQDFIYERTWVEGVKLELVTGGLRYHGKVWREIAKQIYCENGKDGYRDLGHFKSGAPFLYDADEKISISHTEGCLAVATVKVCPDADLSSFSPEDALGVDVERADREKVMQIRSRFLTEEEQLLVPPGSLEANVVAWTCKEAMLKAGMDPAIDWLHNIVISKLPLPDGENGAGHIIIDGGCHDLVLTTVRSHPFIVTIARSPQLRKAGNDGNICENG